MTRTVHNPFSGQACLRQNWARVGLLSICALSMSACVTSQSALSTHSEYFGQAVQKNIAAQHVRPTPSEQANTFIPANLARKDLAIERYKNDEAEEPVPIKTLN